MLKRSLSLLLVCFIAATAMAQSRKEANLKAVFIYNFTRYIEWDSTSPGVNDFLIGIIGPSSVTTALMEIARTNRVGHKRIVIRRFDKPEDISTCHILFIPQNMPFSLASVLERTPKGVLTVGEANGFAKQGTAFNFIISRDKLKFEANLKSLFVAGLKVSSQLLKLAVIVD
ncbi:MAG TPA: YfiR family protein [Chitinophagaceae bacterium]|nr:YfiR family protein [Chitinophagaceae bacterium]